MNRGNSCRLVVRPFKDRFGKITFRAFSFTPNGFKISSSHSCREQAYATALAQAVRPTLGEMIRYFHAQKMLPQKPSYVKEAIAALGPYANKDVFEIDKRVTRKIAETLAEAELTKPNIVKSVVRGAFKLLVEMGLDVKVPTFPHKGKDNFAFVTEDQAAQIVENDDYGLFAMAVLTGLRTGELLKLKWSSIDFDAKTIRVKAFKHAKKDTYIPLTPAVEMVLSKIPRTGKYVWWGQSPDKPMCHNAIQTRWARFKRKLGLPHDLRIHDLRASYATMLVRNGVSVMTAKALLRHANISTTMSYYLRFVPQDAVEAAMMLSGKLCDGQLVQGAERSVCGDVPGLRSPGGRSANPGGCQEGDSEGQGHPGGLCGMGVR